MTIGELQQEFLASGSPSIAPEDFFLLLAHSIKKEKIFVMAHPEHILGTESESHARIFFVRRISGEPVAFIVGHKAFYGRDFLVTKDTLIPRPETELLVDLVLDRIKNYESKIKNEEKNIHILDIGTGSGNIIISIASELIHSQFSIHHSPFTMHATDISERAVRVAKKNAKQYGVDRSIKFHTGDLLKPLSKKLLTTGEIIITANLPYLSSILYKNTPKDVRLFEPKSALVSGKKGLDHYTRLLQDVGTFLPQENTLTLFLEISPEQSTSLQALASTLFPGARLHIHHDLANKARVLEIHRKKHPQRGGRSLV